MNIQPRILLTAGKEPGCSLLAKALLKGLCSFLFSWLEHPRYPDSTLPLDSDWKKYRYSESARKPLFLHCTPSRSSGSVRKCLFPPQAPHASLSVLFPTHSGPAEPQCIGRRPTWGSDVISRGSFFFFWVKHLHFLCSEILCWNYNKPKISSMGNFTNRGLWLQLQNKQQEQMELFRNNDSIFMQISLVVKKRRRRKKPPRYQNGF